MLFDLVLSLSYSPKMETFLAACYGREKFVAIWLHTHTISAGGQECCSTEIASLPMLSS
jgi:hypothetical protein